MKSIKNILVVSSIIYAVGLCISFFMDQEIKQTAVVLIPVSTIIGLFAYSMAFLLKRAIKLKEHIEKN